MIVAWQVIEEKAVEIEEDLCATLAVSFVGRGLLSMRSMRKGERYVLKAGIGMSEFVSDNMAMTFHTSATGATTLQISEKRTHLYSMDSMFHSISHCHNVSGSMFLHSGLSLRCFTCNLKGE